MAQRELEAALRRDGEKKAREIWQTVEAEAARLRDATAQTRDHRQQAAAARRRMESAALLETALAAARRQGQDYRLAAEDGLAERLKGLARGLLEEIARKGGAELFQALAAEIPDYPWQGVRVKGRDEAAARDTFPGADIALDPQLSGGLEVESADGRIRIINTLAKRLEHLWPELLPQLFNEIRPMAGDDEAVV